MPGNETPIVHLVLDSHDTRKAWLYWTNIGAKLLYF